jgi:hypothetical protein
MNWSPNKAPTKSALNSLIHCICQHMAGFFKRESLPVRDGDKDYLAINEQKDDPMLHIYKKKSLSQLIPQV